MSSSTYHYCSDLGCPPLIVRLLNVDLTSNSPGPFSTDAILFEAVTVDVVEADDKVVVALTDPALVFVLLLLVAFE